jgi:hypothetical protein
MDALNILKHHAEKFGVVTVIDATIYDLATGGAILELDTLKVANFATEVQEKVITGGQANDQLIIYNHSRTATLDLQDAIASMSSLEYLWGTGRVVHATDEINEHTKGDFTYVALDTLADLVSGYVEETVATLYNQTTEATEILSLGASVPTASADDVITVWYEKSAAVGAQALTLSSSSFAANVKVVGKTFFIDKITGAKKYAELVIHKYKLNPSFELNFDATGDASMFDFSGTALVDGSGDIVTIKYLTV